MLTRFFNDFSPDRLYRNRTTTYKPKVEELCKNVHQMALEQRGLLPSLLTGKWHLTFGSRKRKTSSFLK
jgi:hypothetical protein